MHAHAQPLGNLLHGVAPLGDLTHGVAFEIVAEIDFAHDGLLASKLAKKVSTNLGVIQPYIRQKANEVLNLYPYNPVEVRRIVSCTRTADRLVDHYLSSIKVSIPGFAVYEFQLGRLKDELKLKDMFTGLSLPYGVSLTASEIPLRGMLALKSEEKDYFSRYCVLRNWVSKKIAEVGSLEQHQEARLVQFLINQLVFAPSKND